MMVATVKYLENGEIKQKTKELNTQDMRQSISKIIENITGSEKYVNISFENKQEQ